MHQLIVLDQHGNERFRSEASSALPGAQSVIGSDEDTGLPGVLTQIENDAGVRYEMLALSDGSVFHRVILADGLITEVVSYKPGSRTELHSDGRIETVVPGSVDGQQVRVVALTMADGQGHLRYERFDEVLDAWQLVSETVDPISPFEPGHLIEIDQGPNGLSGYIRTGVSRDVYF